MLGNSVFQSSPLMVFCLYFISQGRSHLSHEKEMFAHDHPNVRTLEEVVQTVKPTAIIGNCWISFLLHRALFLHCCHSSTFPVKKLILCSKEQRYTIFLVHITGDGVAVPYSDWYAGCNTSLLLSGGSRSGGIP